MRMPSVTLRGILAALVRYTCMPALQQAYQSLERHSTVLDYFACHAEVTVLDA